MHREHADWKTPAITPETYERLLAALHEVYSPEKIRRTVEVCPHAVIKTIDNEADALETIQRIVERKRTA